MTPCGIVVCELYKREVRIYENNCKGFDDRRSIDTDTG